MVYICFLTTFLAPFLFRGSQVCVFVSQNQDCSAVPEEASPTAFLLCFCTVFVVLNVCVCVCVCLKTSLKTMSLFCMA